MLIGQMGILIVDDVNAMRMQIKDLMKSFGFRKVMTAPSGQEAMQMMEANPIHLVLCDWQMHPVTGLEFLSYIRKHPEFSKTAFIMVTADSTRDRVIEAIKAGVDDYIVKPLTHNQIQDKVYSVLLRRQLL